LDKAWESLERSLQLLLCFEGWLKDQTSSMKASVGLDWIIIKEKLRIVMVACDFQSFV